MRRFVSAANVQCLRNAKYGNVMLVNMKPGAIENQSTEKAAA